MSDLTDIVGSAHMIESVQLVTEKYEYTGNHINSFLFITTEELFH